MRSYLAWLGIHNRWYNVGNYRRTVVGSDLPNDWFDPLNSESTTRSWVGVEVLRAIGRS